MAYAGSSNFPDYGSTGSPNQWARSTKTSNFTIYHQLCDNISCNIFSINNHVSGLEKASREIGTPTDSPLLRDKIHRTQQSANELIESTTRFLRELNEIVQRGSKADKESRIQSERLRNEFQATVQRYSTLQKQLGPKMKRTMVTQMNRTENTGAVGWNPEDDEGQSLIDSERNQRQLQLQEELEFEQEMLQERERRIREIESDMIDVNQIFRDLATMVHEQGETLGTIEENVTVAAANAEEGAQQLEKASQYQAKYRKKLCWLVIILLVIVAVILIIVVPPLASKT